MTRTQMAIVAVVFGAAFAVSGIIRDAAVAPSLVGGALGAVLVYVVLQRVTEQHALRRRREHRRREG